MYGITETGAGVLTQLDAGYLVSTADGHLSTSDVSICLQLMVDLCTTDGSHGYLHATCHSSMAKLHLAVLQSTYRVYIMYRHCTHSVRTLLRYISVHVGFMGAVETAEGKIGLNPVL
jgi:hypothetical protein